MATPTIYTIPKLDKGYLENRETYAKKIIEDVYKLAPIQTNASVVNGFDIIQTDYKFIKLLDEAYKCFLLGLYHSTVSLCSVATERLCYDILEKSKINFDDAELDNKQKKAFFKIPYTTLIELLRSCGLITEQIAKEMITTNNLRQTYVHPLLEGNPYRDAKDSLNRLCDIIDSYFKMKKNSITENY